MYTEWENKKDQFKVIDLRQAKGNFSQGLFRQADQVPEGSGLQIIQSFEPHPLYEAMKDRGFEYHVEEVKPYEFHIWFYRSEAKPASARSLSGRRHSSISRSSTRTWAALPSNSGTKRGMTNAITSLMKCASSSPWPMPSAPAATVRLQGNWSKPISTASIPVPSTTSSNSSPGTRASASSAPRLARRRSSVPTN